MGITLGHKNRWHASTENTTNYRKYSCLYGNLFYNSKLRTQKFI